MNNLILDIDSLIIGYDKPLALKPISFKAYQGDVVALIGSNGLGKSTLLRTLFGKNKPLEGSIKINHNDLSSLSPIQRAKLVSVVLTERPDDLFLTVKNVVASGRFPFTGLFGKMSDNDENKVKVSLELLGVYSLINRYFHSLSDGEKQKVMIAKTLAQDSPLILMDEPMAFLDYESRIDLCHLMKNLAEKENKTIIFSSHDIDIIEKFQFKTLRLERK